MRKVKRAKISFDDSLQLQFDFGEKTDCCIVCPEFPMSDSEKEKYEKELNRTISNIIRMLSSVS